MKMILTILMKATMSTMMLKITISKMMLTTLQRENVVLTDNIIKNEPIRDSTQLIIEIK